MTIHNKKETVKINYDELMFNLDLAREYLAEANNELALTKGVDMEKDKYNAALKFASTLILDSRIN
ncbi:hypothetical protein phiLdb_00043 [Lactobacillus phage phiLdb]|uniref:Uncharacterized protein n=1 Tax=Lactobacillus phage phiLdb TaxID=1399942 RepID=U3PIZ3_9CAUD|nr:hypothetical protein phiLdb_00043 [Lactobacillus phage phiLdb]AGW43720.1 hypothetical protein phiLdb_00043 [Lactobacillus phage phiLdb]